MNLTGCKNQSEFPVRSFEPGGEQRMVSVDGGIT